VLLLLGLEGLGVGRLEGRASAGNPGVSTGEENVREVIFRVHPDAFRPALGTPKSCQRVSIRLGFYAKKEKVLARRCLRHKENRKAAIILEGSRAGDP
jgi:hypothetical protein